MQAADSVFYAHDPFAHLIDAAWVQIAAVRHDGAPLDPQNENRTINLDILETNEISGDRSRTDTVQIPTDTSIAEYWFNPSSTTSRIFVTVSRVDFVLEALYSRNNSMLFMVTHNQWLCESQIHILASVTCSCRDGSSINLCCFNKP